MSPMPTMPAMSRATTPPAARPATPADPAQAWKAAKDFEAMVLGEFLKPMFETVSSKRNPFSGGNGEETWKPMMVEEIGKQIAASGGLGLAAPIHAAMLRMSEGRS